MSLAVFRADFFSQPSDAHPHGMCAGITEADQNRPDGIEETLFFRPESVFATDERPFLYIKGCRDMRMRRLCSPVTGSFSPDGYRRARAALSALYSAQDDTRTDFRIWV